MNNKNSPNNDNSSLVIVVEKVLSGIELKIKQLNEIDTVKHQYEIQFLEYLQSNFIRLGDFRDQLCTLIPYYQQEIASNWDHVIDGKSELQKKKQEVETLKQQVDSIQTEEVNLQKEKKKLSNQLKTHESELIKNQDRFNKTGKKIDDLHSRLEIISQLEQDPDDNFLNKFVVSRNRIRAKRLGRLVSDRTVEANNLSEQIQIKQEQITETTEEVEFQQKHLKELQIENIQMRRKLESIMNSIKQNGLEIQQAEKEIDYNNEMLRKLSVSLVEIANETIRQQSIYKKSSLAPLDDIDYQNLLHESTFSNKLEKEIEELLDPRNSLPSEF